MNDDDGIWTLEQDFWLKGAEHYEQVLDPHCLMAFPAPTGIMGRDEVLASLRDAPRWDSVEMSGQTTVEPADNLKVIGYQAVATRGGTRPYAATCLSTYRRSDQVWLMTSHQQTPENR
jgi:hypothetical protein